MIKKKFLPVLLIIVGLIGWIPYNAQKDKSEVTIQTLSETHVNYKDAEEYTQFIEQLSRKAQETEKKRRLTETKVVLEKNARAKAEEAKKVAEAKKEEEAKKAEEERIAKEIAQEEARVAQEAKEASEAAALAAVVEEAEEASVIQEVPVANEPAYTEPVANEGVEQAAPVQARTDGFNFNGYHFDIAWFSGSGQVPADSYVYRWSTDPSHYLVEMMGVAGGVIRELHVGSQIVIDGQRYTISHMQTGVSNDENAYYNMKDVGAALTFQTCDYQIGANGRYNLTIWYANPS